MESLAPLRTVREARSACVARRAAAVCEVGDALLVEAPVPALPHVRLPPSHRRGWGSIDAARADGRLEAARLRAALAALPLGGGQPIYAVDGSVWPRCDAEASPDREFSDHSSRHAAGQPIVAGWAYQWVAPLGLDRDSWTAPVDAQRGHPTEQAEGVAVRQIQALVVRLLGSAVVPRFVVDAGDDSVALTQGLAAAPKPCGRSPGRPRGRGSGRAPRYPAVKETAGRAHPQDSAPGTSVPTGGAQTPLRSNDKLSRLPNVFPRILSPPTLAGDEPGETFPPTGRFSDAVPSNDAIDPVDPPSWYS